MKQILTKNDFQDADEFGAYVLDGISQSFETTGEDVDERELSAALLSIALFYLPALVSRPLPALLLFVIKAFGFRRSDDRVFVHYITVLRYLAEITGSEIDDLLFDALQKENVSIFQVFDRVKIETKSKFISKIIDIILKLQPNENNA